MHAPCFQPAVVAAAAAVAAVGVAGAAVAVPLLAGLRHHSDGSDRQRHRKSQGFASRHGEYSRLCIKCVSGASEIDNAQTYPFIPGLSLPEMDRSNTGAEHRPEKRCLSLLKSLKTGQ